MLKLNLRNRIMIIYLLCILIPVLVVNGILYFYLSEDLFDYENENREASTERFAVKSVNQMNHFRNLNSGLYGIEDITDPHVVDLTTLVADGSIVSEGWYQRLNQTPGASIVTTRSEGPRDRRLVYYTMLPNNGQNPRVNELVVTTDFLDEIAREEYSEGLYLLVNQFNDIVYASTDTFGTYDAYDSVLIFQKNEDFYYSEFIYNDMTYVEGWRIIGIFPKEDIYENLIDRRNLIILVVFTGLLVATILMTSLSLSINRRFKKLNRQVENIKAGNFTKVSIQSPKDELGHFIGEFHEMTDQMNILVNEVYEKELEKKNLVIEKQQAELNALQSQVNPHFLYNVMNTIRMKSVVKGEAETAKMLKYVAAMFRRVINWEADLITIREEISFVEEYLKVQKYRFEDRLTYDLSITEEVKEALIPKMTLQTFIENASTHGLENQVEGCRVSLNAELVEGKVKIMVTDDGNGMSRTALENLLSYIDNQEQLGESVGMKNVYQRLKIYFGDQMTFNIQSTEGLGTKITLQIPAHTKETL